MMTVTVIRGSGVVETFTDVVETVQTYAFTLGRFSIDIVQECGKGLLTEMTIDLKRDDILEIG